MMPPWKIPASCFIPFRSIHKKGLHLTSCKAAGPPVRSKRPAVRRSQPLSCSFRHMSRGLVQRIYLLKREAAREQKHWKVLELRAPVRFSRMHIKMDERMWSIFVFERLVLRGSLFSFRAIIHLQKVLEKWTRLR